MYQVKEAALKEYAKREAGLAVRIFAAEYPWRATFYPDDEMSIFDGSDCDENGELRNITISTGLTLELHSSMGFRLDASIFKKLISLTDKCGQLYYVACREIEYERIQKK